MIDPKNYSDVFHTIILIVVIFTWVSAKKSLISSQGNLTAKKYFGFLLLLLIVFFIGLRPVSYYFGDMVVYSSDFDRKEVGKLSKKVYEWGFDFLMNFHVNFLTKTLFFFNCMLIYTGLMYVSAKKLFKEYHFYAFLTLVGSFSYLGYGVNGIRNGLGTSIFIFAIAFFPRYILLFGLMYLSTLFHKSMMLPLICFCIGFFLHKQVKYFLFFWTLCILLSLAFGGLWENLFASLGFADEKANEYLVGKGYEKEFSQTGFRWDFLLYSASAVYAIWYFIIKRKFTDKLYGIISITYLLANGFWILVIRANFSNRFAYLSWFLMGLVIIYPMLKQNFFRKQHQVIAAIILLYFAFTYLMNVILY